MTNRDGTNTDYLELRRLLLRARDGIDEVLAAIASLEREASTDFALYLEVEQVKVRVTEAANELLPNDPDFNLEAEDETYCEDCGYYADSTYLVCALHPTGPVELDCSDYEDAVREAVQLPLDKSYENPWHPDPEENWSPLGTKYVDGELVFVGQDDLS